MNKEIKLDRNYAESLLIVLNVGINVKKPEHILHLKCKCGKEAYIEGKQWIISFYGTVCFKCPCGEEHTLNEKSPDVADKIIKVLKDNYWQGGCGEIHLKKEINRVLNG